MKRSLIIILLLADGGAAQPNRDPFYMTPDAVVQLFEGDDPARWPPERIYETMVDKGRFNDDRSAWQSLQLRLLIDRQPEVYGPLAAHILESGTNAELFGYAAENVRVHPDPDRARYAVVAFLRRTDIDVSQVWVEIAAGTLEKVGRAEDADAIRPHLERVRPGPGRRNLWISLSRFAGPEYLQLLDAEIATLHAALQSDPDERILDYAGDRAYFISLTNVRREFAARLTTRAAHAPPTPTAGNSDPTSLRNAVSGSTNDAGFERQRKRTSSFPSWSIPLAALAAAAFVTCWIWWSFVRKRPRGPDRRS